MAPIGVSFLIPAYNEAATILEVLERIEALGLDVEIIVVDDGSTDDTAALVAAYAAEHPGVLLLRQPNTGKGMKKIKAKDTKITTLNSTNRVLNFMACFLPLLV